MNLLKKHFITGIATSICLAVSILTSSVFAAPITVSQAVQNIQKSKSYNFDGSITLSLKPKNASDTAAAILKDISFGFCGKFDNKNISDVKRYIDIKAKLKSLGMEIDLPIYFEGNSSGTKGTCFLKIPEIMKVLLKASDDGDSSDVNLDNVTMGYADVEDFYKELNKDNDDEDDKISNFDIEKISGELKKIEATLLNYFSSYVSNKANKNVAFIADKNISENIGGTYKINFNSVQIKNFFDGLFDNKDFQKTCNEIMEAEGTIKIPADSSEFSLSKADFDKEFSKTDDNVLKNLSFTLILGIKDCNLNYISYSANNESGKMAMTVNISNINGPVNIVMPKKDKNCINLLKDLDNYLTASNQNADDQQSSDEDDENLTKEPK